MTERRHIRCVGLLMAAISLTQCSEGQAPPQVVVVPPPFVAAEGKVETRPGLETEIGSGLTAALRSMRVKPGERVARGQVIAVLEDADLTAALQLAQADLAVAQTKLEEIKAGARRQEIAQARAALQRAVAEGELAGKERLRASELFKENTVSRATMDQQESAHAAAVARIQEARAHLDLLEAGPKLQTIDWYEAQVAAAAARVALQQALLDKTRITSPIDGVFIERFLDEGEVAMPEKPLGVIADVDQLRINAEVDETDAGRVHVGDEAQISSYAFPGEFFRGRVEELADYVGKRELKPNNPAVNLGLKILQVKIALLEPTPLKLGMTVDVRIGSFGDKM
jgi:multidrug resistance efflux pump